MLNFWVWFLVNIDGKFLGGRRVGMLLEKLRYFNINATIDVGDGFTVFDKSTNKLVSKQELILIAKTDDSYKKLKELERNAPELDTWILKIKHKSE